MGRGRPKLIKQEPLADTFTREYCDEDGVITQWVYDLRVTKNGPIEVSAIYPKGHELFVNQDDVTKAKSAKSKVKLAKTPISMKNLPKSKQTYLNPATNKMVGYTRAKMLGLI